MDETIKKEEEKIDYGEKMIPSIVQEKKETDLVASHYNAIPEVGIQQRNNSPILHLRNMNNWMKSMLIGLSFFILFSNSA
jgi:mRNA (guanine-N7-)-methyltransferase